MFVCFKLITSNCQDKFLGQNQKDFNQCRENILFIVLNYSLTCVMTFFIIKYLGGGFEHRLVIFLFFFGLIWLLQWRRGDLNLEVLEISRSVNQLNYKVLGMYNYFILYYFIYKKLMYNYLLQENINFKMLNICILWFGSQWQLYDYFIGGQKKHILYKI